MTKKAHKAYLKKINQEPKITGMKNLNPVPENCTNNNCPHTTDRPCKGCWYDKEEKKRREDVMDGK